MTMDEAIEWARAALEAEADLIEADEEIWDALLAAEDEQSAADAARRKARG